MPYQITGEDYYHSRPLYKDMSKNYFKIIIKRMIYSIKNFILSYFTIK